MGLVGVLVQVVLKFCLDHSLIIVGAFGAGQLLADDDVEAILGLNDVGVVADLKRERGLFIFGDHLAGRESQRILRGIVGIFADGVEALAVFQSCQSLLGPFALLFNLGLAERGLSRGIDRIEDHVAGSNIFFRVIGICLRFFLIGQSVFTAVGKKREQL